MPTRNANTNSEQHPPLFAAGNMLPFFLVTALFLFWGIPSNMNDILIKQFMKSFELTRFKAGLIQSAFYMGYFLLAVPAALVMREIWVQNRTGDRSVPLQRRDFSLLAGGAGSTVWIFPLCPVRHRQWRILPGNRSKLLYRAVGRPANFRTTAQFLPGL